MNPLNTEPCFLVLRWDEDRVTVKLVCWSKEEAERHVVRLNTLNGHKARYEWLTSRALRRPG